MAASVQRQAGAAAVLRLAAALGVTAVLGTVAGCAPEAADATAAPPQPPEVSVVQPLQRKIVEWDQYTGRLAAVDAVEVRARVGGHLRSLHFADGQEVQEGDLLFIIDPRPFQAELNSARAELREAEAKLKEAESLRRQAQAQKAQADAAERLARQRQQRAENLVQQNAMSREEYDQRASELVQAQADVEAASANIEAANANVETGKAAIVVAQATVENAELQLAYTEIRAPISGRISSRLVTPGNLITGGTAQSTLLTTIVSANPIHCYFDVNEREVLNYTRMIHSGARESSREGDYRNPVYMKLADETGFPHLGHIDFVDNRIDPNTGTMRARAIFPNPQGLLTPGMFAELRLPGSRPYEAVMVPDAVVGTDQSETFVYVVGADDTIERRAVELGPLSHGLRIIREGLAAGDQLVASGLQLVRPGAVVRTTPAPPIEWTDAGALPDTVDPVPRDKWLSARPMPELAPARMVSDGVPSARRNR